jgi:hypothetical protein
LAVKWKRSTEDRLIRLAEKIEKVASQDQKAIDEGAEVDRLREEGAAGLYRLCRDFVDDLNSRLSQPALIIDPPDWGADSFRDGGTNLFQISLRGRLLQLEFTSTDEPYSTEDFRHRYVLRGGVRSFNQNFLEQDTVDEQHIFFCAGGDHPGIGPAWHFFDARTYRTGLLSADYLAAEMERLL